MVQPTDEMLVNFCYLLSSICQCCPRKQSPQGDLQVCVTSVSWRPKSQGGIQSQPRVWRGRNQSPSLRVEDVQQVRKGEGRPEFFFPQHLLDRLGDAQTLRVQSPLLSLPAHRLTSAGEPHRYTQKNVQSLPSQTGT